MRRLLSLALASLPFAGPAWANDAAEPALTRSALIARSTNPAFADRILYRSTGTRPKNPQPLSQARTKTVVSPVPSPSGTVDRPTRNSQPDPTSLLPDSPTNVPHIEGLSSSILRRIDLYDDLIERYSRLNDLEPNLVRAVIYVESGGDPGAESHKGARGLMQLMPATAMDVGVSNPGDPAQNIFGGTRYLASLVERFKRVDLALWGYNAGPETVKNRRLPAETKRYIPEVLRVKALLDDQEGA